MKTYKSKGSLIKRINQTLLKYIDYQIITVDGKFTASFTCLSDLEVKAANNEGFPING